MCGVEEEGFRTGGWYSRAIDFEPEPGPRSRNCVVRFSLSFFAMSTFCRNLLSWKERRGIISALVTENFRFPRKNVSNVPTDKVAEDLCFLGKMTSAKHP